MILFTARGAENAEKKNFFMMKAVSLVGILAAVVLGAGCVQVPSSVIRFGNASAQLPKDLTADKLELVLVSGTNTMKFSAAKLSTKNSPEVINASTAQLEAVINATANAAGQAAAEALKAAAK